MLLKPQSSNQQWRFDITQNFDAFSQACSYTLADVLRTKVVRCFKQEMRAGFRFEPGRFGRRKNRNEEMLLAESQQGCTPVPSQGLIPVHNADPSSSSWTRFKNLRGSRTVTLEGEASADPGHLPGSSRTQSSAEVNGVCGKFCEEMCTPTNSSGMSPRVYSRENPAGTGDLTDTCQRVRLFFRKTWFSCARTDMPWPLLSSGLSRASRTATPACPALLADPPDTVSSSISTNKQDVLNGCANEKLFSAPDGPSSGSTQWINHQDESRDGFLPGGNDERQGNTSSHSPDSTKVAFAPFQGEAARTSPALNGLGVHRRESSADINSPLPHSGHQPDRSGASPSPSAGVLSDMETTSSLYSVSPPQSFQARGAASVTLAGASSPCSNTKSLEKQLFVFEVAQEIPCSSSLASAHSCDSLHSSASSLLLPQDRRDCDEDPLSPSPQCCHVGSPTDDENNAAHSLLCRTCGESDTALPPMRSLVTPAYGCSWRDLLSWSPGSSERKEHEAEDTCRHRSPQPVHGNGGNPSVGFDGSGEVLNSTPLTEPQFSPSNQNGTEPSSPSTCADVSSDALDEVMAYNRDILLVDVTQDDTELFGNLPQKSLLKLGPVRRSEELKHRPLGTARKHQLTSNGASAELGQRLSS